jgi:hypothetical protein
MDLDERKVGSIERSSLKREARRFPENRSVSHPVRALESFEHLLVFLNGYLETNCQHGHEIHNAIVNSGNGQIKKFPRLFL